MEPHGNRSAGEGDNWMTDPVLVEVTRGDSVESAHRGAISIFDFDGREVLALGDAGRPTFPRSAVKAIQALPLIETGAADAKGFGERELALACASHSGEPGHAELAASMLAASGLGEADLECGWHWPSSHDATLELARAGAMPSQLHNNCSGKHSAFLTVCVHCGLAPQGYVAVGHPFQEMVRETMQEVTGAAHGEANRGVDGCSIPTYAVPLKSLALGFARMGGGKGLGPERAKAARRLLAANMKHPWLVAGTGRADTALMKAAPGRIFVKTGAEGVYGGVAPEHVLAFAIKCDDGAGRGSESAVAGLLARLFAKDAALSARLDEIARPAIRTRKGAVVGGARPAEAIARIAL